MKFMGKRCISSEVFTMNTPGVRLATARKRGVLPRSLFYYCLLTVIAAIFVQPIVADTIQLPHGAELTIEFAMPGFNPVLPGALFPTTIGLELAGPVPDGSKTAPIPGSSKIYYTGFLFEGSLRSLDGSVSLPLFDADAWRLGLASGSLIASDSLDANGNRTAIVSAEVAVSLNASEAIFGPMGQAAFVIQNDGGDFTIGLGPGFSLSNAILAPLTASNGDVQSAGYLQNVSMSSAAGAPAEQSVPEPAAFEVAILGGLALLWMRCRLRP
jgi:hypothetical protein